MEVSGHLHAPVALSAGKEPLKVLIEDIQYNVCCIWSSLLVLKNVSSKLTLMPWSNGSKYPSKTWKVTIGSTFEKKRFHSIRIRNISQHCAFWGL
jgi:hypothetical protein